MVCVKVRNVEHLVKLHFSIGFASITYDNVVLKSNFLKNYARNYFLWRRKWQAAVDCKAVVDYICKIFKGVL